MKVVSGDEVRRLWFRTEVSFLCDMVGRSEDYIVPFLKEKYPEAVEPYEYREIFDNSERILGDMTTPNGYDTDGDDHHLKDWKPYAALFNYNELINASFWAIWEDMVDLDSDQENMEFANYLEWLEVLHQQDQGLLTAEEVKEKAGEISDREKIFWPNLL